MNKNISPYRVASVVMIFCFFIFCIAVFIRDVYPKIRFVLGAHVVPPVTKPSY